MRQTAIATYCMLPLLALAIALPNLPGKESVFEAQAPPSGNLLDLFAPQQFNGEVESGWVFYDVALLQEALRISLRKNGNKFWVYFIPPQNPRHLSAACSSLFCIHIPVHPPEGDPSFSIVAQLMADSLAGNLDERRPLFLESSRPTNLPAPWYELGFLTMLVALGLVAWRGLRDAIASRDWSAGLLVAIFGTGLWTRLAWVVQGPLHNNHHGAEELDYWLVPPESLFPSYYGRGHQAICDVLFAILPRSFNSYMTVAAAVGALSCVMAVLVTRELTGDRRWGWFAGFALALHPIAMRGAASESTFNFAALFILLTLWGLLRYRRGGFTSHLLLGHAALCLAIVAHILTLSLIILPLLVLLVPSGLPRSMPRLIRQMVAWGTSALLALPHAVYEWQADMVRSGAVGDPAKLLQAMTSYGNLLLDPSETPWMLNVLAVATLLLLRRKSWRIFVLLCSLCALMVPFYLVHASFSDLVRYQIIPATLSVVVAGVGAELLFALVPEGWRRTATTGALVGLLALNFALLNPASNQHDAGSQEYQTLQHWAATMPQSGMLVLPRGLEAHVQFHSYFPALILQDQGLAYTVVTIPEFEQMLAAGEWPDEPVLYYEGLQLLWIIASDDLENPELHHQITAIVAETERVRSYADAHKTLLETIIAPTINPGCAGEFTELPPNAAIGLYRLVP